MFLSLRLVALFALLVGTSPLWVEQLAAPAAAEPEVQVSEAAAKVDAAELIVVVESDKFRLAYPLVFDEVIPLREIVARLLEAFDRVENEFGAFENPVDVYVPGKIPHEEAEALGLAIAGVTFVQENGQVTVLVALWAATDIDTFAHELLHARLRDAGISLPGWLEEGLAHFIESEDGFNEELYELLLKTGPIDPKEAAEIEGITEDEMRLRATAWLITYYLHEFEGMTLGEIAKAESLPNPFRALEIVKNVRESRAAVSKELATRN